MARDPAVSIDQIEVIRSLSHHIASVEAQLWGALRFMSEKGILDDSDYQNWMQAHESDVTEAMASFHERIAQTLSEHASP